MRHHIPDHWKPLLRAHVLQTRGVDRDYLGASDFPSGRGVRVEWADKSFAVFRYAFYLRDEVAQQVAVFTEHCGYHFYSTSDDYVVVTELKE